MLNRKRQNLRFKDEYKAKKKKKFRSKVIGFTVLALLFLASLLYFAFFGGFFDVRSIKINSPESIQSQDLRNDINFWLEADIFTIKRKDNAFLLSLDDLKNKLLSDFPRIESLEIKRDSRHDFEVSIVDRKAVGVWCLVKNSQCFYFDGQGVAFADAPSSMGTLLINVQDNRSKDMPLGKSIEDKSWVDNFAVSRKLLIESGIDLTGFEIAEDSIGDFKAKTVAGWDVLLSNSTDIPSQIASLRLFLKNKLSSEEQKNLTYIDLRIQDRIYYK